MRLLDTTVAVDHLRGYPPAVNLLRRLIGQGEVLACSELVRFELMAGVRAPETEALEAFFSVMTWISVDEAVARVAGDMARRHRAAFSGIGAADYINAATSALLDAPLLTANVRHFPMLPGLEPAYDS